MFGKKKTSEEDLISRQRILYLTPQSLLAFMTTQRWVIVEGELPEDVRFGSVFFDPNLQVFGVVCMSKEFKSLKVAEPRPQLPPVKFRFYNPSKDGVIE